MAEKKGTSEKAIARLVAEEVTAIFSHLDKNEVIEGKDSGKRSITARFDASNPKHMALLDTIQGYQEQAKTAMIAKKGDKIAGYEFANWKRPAVRKEGDELIETDDFQVTFRCSGEYPPKVYGLNGETVAPESVTFGSKVVLEFQLVPYAMAATKKVGVSLRLNGVLVLKKGEGSTQLHDIAAKYRKDYSQETTAGTIAAMEKSLEQKTA